MDYVQPLSAAAVYTDFRGLAELKRRAREDSPEALREAARQFEALFLQMLLKSMREANLGEGLFDSDRTRFYQGLFDQQIALQLAGGGTGLGLAELLVRQMGGRGVQGTSAAHAPDVTQDLRAPRAQGSATHGSDFGSPAEFVTRLRPHAQRAADELGIAPEMLLAQAALETGWGRAVIRDANGRSTHNLFGIKADGRWRGAYAAVPSLEYEGGVTVRRVSRFRAYGSYEESFRDYVRFLRETPRYRAALDKVHDPAAFATALQEAGYATDPDYARKLLAVLGSRPLAVHAASLKEDAGEPLT